jgi:hypothetical protein
VFSICTVLELLSNCNKLAKPQRGVWIDTVTNSLRHMHKNDEEANKGDEPDREGTKECS